MAYGNNPTRQLSPRPENNVEIRHIIKNFPVIESEVVVADSMSTQGRPCERLPTQFVKDCGYIPVVLTNAAFVIEKNLKTKGLFQTQGNVSKVNACLNHLLAPRLSKIKHENVHDVIEAIKAFLVRLPEPLMPESVCDALISRSPEADSASQYVAVLTKFRQSSPHSFAILHFMMMLLKRISEYSQYNTMDVRKLATVFVLDIIKPLKLEDSNEGLFLIERMQRLPYLIMVVENIIKRVDIFHIINSADYQPSQKGSPIVVEHSNSSLPPTGYKSSSSEMHGLAHPKLEGNERSAVAFAGQHDVAESFPCGQTKDRRHELNERVLPKPAELVTRAASEPQKETAYTVDICKRCATALPACTSGVDSETAGSTGDSAREGSIANVTVQEASAHSLAVSFGPSEDKYNAGLFNAADVLHRKANASKVNILGRRKLSTTRGSTSSPVRRKSTKKGQDEPSHYAWEVKSYRSMDTSVSAPHSKRRRKCRCTSKKSKCSQDRSLTETFCRGSDFTTFQPDEEITPWNEGSTNSDDTSVMVKTIRNPRVLAQAAASPVKPETQIDGENEKTLKDNISSEKVTRLFLANYGFRTISSQNNLPHSSDSGRTTSSSGTSFCANMPCPATQEECGQSTSNETTLISKELIRGVKLKGSVGVNTSPCLQFSAAKVKVNEIQKAPEKPKEAPIVKTPTTCVKEIKQSPRTNTAVVNKSAVTATTKRTPTASTTTEMVPRLRAPVSGIPPPSAHSQQHYPRLSVPSQLSISEKSYSSHIKLRQQQLRKTLKSSGSFLEQKTRRKATTESFIPSLFTREWFVDVILAVITVIFISLIFLYYEQDKPKGNWLK